MKEVTQDQIAVLLDQTLFVDHPFVLQDQDQIKYHICIFLLAALKFGFICGFKSDAARKMINSWAFGQ